MMLISPVEKDAEQADDFEFINSNERMSDILSSKPDNHTSVKFDPTSFKSNEEMVSEKRSNTNNESFHHLNKVGGEGIEGEEKK